MNVKNIRISIQGISPLLTKKWGQDLKKNKDPLCAKRPNGDYAIPKFALTHAIKKAVRFSGRSNAIKVSDNITILGNNGGNLISIKSKKKPVIDVTWCPIRLNKIKIKRGRFDKWQMSFTVKYNSDKLLKEDIKDLFKVSGFCIGLGELRPEGGSSYGMFKVM